MLMIGDIIHCSDQNDLKDAIHSLSDCGIHTESIYSDEHGNQVYQLKVVNIEDETDKLRTEND